MVHVGVGQEDRFDLRRLHRDILIHKNILALLHPAVHQEFVSFRLQICQ